MPEAITLNFIIPVRHQKSVGDWGGVRERLATTLRSIAAQTRDTWRAVVVSNEDAEMPELPQGVDLAAVTFPPPEFTNPSVDLAAFYDEVRADKGRRVLTGLLHAPPSGFVMVVDYDDVVSNRLAEFADDNADANGWFLNTGYVFSSARLAYRRPRDFHELCGTSLILRADLLNVPKHFEDANETYIRRMLGSHKFAKNVFERNGTPLAELPFAGAAYRIGHSESSSRSSGLLKHLTNDFLERPLNVAIRATRLRVIGPRMRDEFFAGSVG